MIRMRHYLPLYRRFKSAMRSSFATGKDKRPQVTPLLSAYYTVTEFIILPSEYVDKSTFDQNAFYQNLVFERYTIFLCFFNVFFS